METNEVFRRLVENERDILRFADRGSHECERRLLRSGRWRRWGFGNRLGWSGGAGGWRDALKIGRSRVAESKLIGIPQSGLPPGTGFRTFGFVAGCGSVLGLARSGSFPGRLAPKDAWPMAPFKEKAAIAAITIAQHLIICSPAFAANIHLHAPSGRFHSGISRHLYS
jgi:hypothetical protein